MARVKITLDHGGIAAMLKSADVARAIGARAEQVRERAASHHSVVKHGVPVEIDHYVTDRAAASVSLAHPAGVPIEAKYGVLATAARGSGLDVTVTSAEMRLRIARARQRRKKAAEHKTRMENDAEYRKTYEAKREAARKKRFAHEVRMLTDPEYRRMYEDRAARREAARRKRAKRGK